MPAGFSNGVLDFEESAVDVAPVGTLRLRRKGGILEASIDGGAFASFAAGVIGAASASAAGTMSAADFSKLLAMYRPKPGTNLTNADATIQPVTDKASQYVLPSTVPLTVNRTLTLGVTSVFAGMRVRIVRIGAGAFTLAVVNGGAGAGTKYTFAASPTEIQAAWFVSDGTDWALDGFEYTVVT